MSLMKCPECGKEISDKAQSCIHCGYPLSNNICTIDGTDYDLTEYVEELRKDSSKASSFDFRFKFIEYVRTINIYEAEELLSMIVQNNSVPKTFSSHHTSALLPRCPKCGSTSISTGARGVNWKLGLIGASKTVNRCANCGYSWEP